jgi:aminoglycoside phosphotransferase (APT) family kinase protein
VKRLVDGIPGSERWATMEAIPKGWSTDEKYRVETDDGQRLLVRISAISKYLRKKLEFDALCRLNSLSILMSRPVDFGVFNGGANVYTITTWVDGADAESALPKLSPDEQYGLGCLAGRILRQIHQMPAPPDQPDWAERFNRKIDRNIGNYEACGIEVPGARRAIRHIESLRHLLTGRPQVFQHGDYHCGNMVITDDGQLGVIDFNRIDYGDPWEEFNRIVWCVPVSAHFASGRIDGYFEGESRVSDEFFQLMSLYVANNLISSVPWAVPFGREQVDIMVKQAESVLGWYRGFETYVPDWYQAQRFVCGSQGER